MAEGVASIYARTEMDFIPPPQWGVWFLNNASGGGPFYIYKDLPLAKAGITSRVANNLNKQRLARMDVHVYRFEVGFGWVKYTEIVKGEDMKQHSLWKSSGKRGPGTLEATTGQLDEAMASILTSIQNQE